jgi:hypothetical protein
MGYLILLTNDSAGKRGARILNFNFKLYILHTMKQFFPLAATLFSLCAIPLCGLFAQSTVQIQTLTVDYIAKQVEFRLSWTDQSTPLHRNKVWVFVDLQAVDDTGMKGHWTPAVLDIVKATAGTVSEQTSRGFFIEGTTTNFSSDITLLLHNAPTKFNWCAYATDYPPNATMHNGTYTLKGTLPFTATLSDGSTVSLPNKTHSNNCIASITDPTGCPGEVSYLAFSAGAIADTGEIVPVGGTPAVIGNVAAASGGDGRVAYQWYKNGRPISAATAATYAPPPTDATTISTISYTRSAKDSTCHSAFVPSTGNWTLTVIPTIRPVSPVESQTVCRNVPITDIIYVTAGLANATISGLPAGVTGIRQNDTIRISGTPTAVGTYTYTVALVGSAVHRTATIIVNELPSVALIAPAATCAGSTYTVSSTGSGALYCFSITGPCAPTASANTTTFTMPAGGSQTIHVTTSTAAGCTATAHKTVSSLPADSIYLVSGLNPQTVITGQAINITYHATSGVAGVDITGLPPGVGWASSNSGISISGTPNTTGVFTYTISATSGCQAVAAGTISIGPKPPAGDTTIWMCGTLAWSGVVKTAPAKCSSVSSLSTKASAPPQYRNYNRNYYYNWACVNAQKNDLCPSPWRLPTEADFLKLASCTSAAKISNDWGLLGYAHSHGVWRVGHDSYYWSGVERNRTQAYSLTHGQGHISSSFNDKHYGYTVRCVTQLTSH